MNGDINISKKSLKNANVDIKLEIPKRSTLVPEQKKATQEKEEIIHSIPQSESSVNRKKLTDLVDRRSVNQKNRPSSQKQGGKDLTENHPKMRKNE